jgi:hypothetical protein
VAVALGRGWWSGKDWCRVRVVGEGKGGAGRKGEEEEVRTSNEALVSRARRRVYVSATKNVVARVRYCSQPARPPLCNALSGAGSLWEPATSESSMPRRPAGFGGDHGKGGPTRMEGARERERRPDDDDHPNAKLKEKRRPPNRGLLCFLSKVSRLFQSRIKKGGGRRG